MLGLGDYDSSSEDEAGINPSLTLKEVVPCPVTNDIRLIGDSEAQQIPANQPLIPEETLDRETSGPFLGPKHEKSHHSHSIDGGPSAPRTLIHDLTLPPFPNLDIPSSPPGSPNPSLNAKFAHFLSLKKQDVHFNEKLAGSVSLKNPSLLKKMMEHAGIDEGAQYATSLPPDIWDTSSFPSWGYKEELLKAQRDRNLKAEAMRAGGERDAIQFVAADSGHSGNASNSKSRHK